MAVANGDTVVLKTAPGLVEAFKDANLYNTCDDRNVQADILAEKTGVASDVSIQAGTFTFTPDVEEGEEETTMIGMPITIIESYETPE